MDFDGISRETLEKKIFSGLSRAVGRVNLEV